jgi:hypothetical protein
MGLGKSILEFSYLELREHSDGPKEIVMNSIQKTNHNVSLKAGG